MNGPCPTGKIPFATLREARPSMLRLERRPYRCKLCGAYHLTHLSKNQFRRAQRQAGHA